MIITIDEHTEANVEKGFILNMRYNENKTCLPTNKEIITLYRLNCKDYFKFDCCHCPLLY